MSTVTLMGHQGRAEKKLPQNAFPFEKDGAENKLRIKINKEFNNISKEKASWKQRVTLILSSP
jgi:hypothetical protein